MKKRLIAVPLFILTFIAVSTSYSIAQGIKFEKGMTWDQVKAKAKAENKYIFLDAYTTWCGICKAMEADVFSKETAGKFYNDNFISVKFQFDVGKNDSPEIKSAYADAKMLATELKTSVYPSYYFYSPEGNLVHQAAGYKSDSALVALGKDAMDNEKQYVKLMEAYRNGKRDSAFVKKLVYMTKDLGDDQLSMQMARDYINSLSLSELYDQKNISFLAEFTRFSGDRGFKVFLNDWNKVKKYIQNPDYAKQMIHYAIVKETIEPALAQAELEKSPVDWVSLENKIISKYTKQGVRSLLAEKALHYYFKKDVTNFYSAKVRLHKEFPGSVAIFDLNNDAWFVFEQTDDKKMLSTALGWSKKAITAEPTTNYYDTYANVLYRLGRREEAIKMMEKGMTLDSGNSPDPESFLANLGKMRAGQPTWPIKK